MAWSNIFNKAADIASNIDTDAIANAAGDIASSEGGNWLSNIDWGNVASKAGTLFDKSKPYLLGMGSDALNQMLNKYKMYNQITSGGAYGLPKYDESLGTKWGQAIQGLGMGTGTEQETEEDRVLSPQYNNKVANAILSALRARNVSAPIRFYFQNPYSQKTSVDEQGYIQQEKQMAEQLNIPGLAKNVFIKKGPEIDPGFLSQIFSNEPQPQQLNSWSNYRPNLSERAEQINKAIEDWQAAKSKQTAEGIKRGATATGKAVKGGINYMKPIAKLGGKVAGAASIPFSVYESAAAKDPFERAAAIATGVGGAGMMFGKSPYITVPSAALFAGGMAAPYIKDWVENNNKEREANKVLERQFLEEELRRRGLL